MNLRAITLNVGKALLVSALFMSLSLVVSIIDGVDSGFMPLLISFVLTGLVGLFPFIFVKTAPAMSMKDGFVTIVLAWLLSFIFGMLPYIMWGGEFTIINAWFESVSGYTTTGSTILNNIEALPKSLLFWRSSTHFIGGLGVVVFLLLVLPQASPYRMKLTNMEMSSLSKDGYRYKSSKVIRIIVSIYIGFVVASFFALWAAGMSAFDALNHAFSIAATGGFSTKNLSIAYYNSDLINGIVLFFMVICAMHFGLLYSVIVTGSLKPMNNAVVKYYFGSILVCSVIIMISLMTQGGYDSWGRAAMDSTFTVVSYMSTAGFAICDNAVWPWLAGVILIFVSFQCGCSGSTTGGIKVDRIVIAFKAVGHEIKRRLHPSSVSQVRISGQNLSDGSVSAVMLFIVAYVFTMFVSVILVMLCGTEPATAVSGVVASIGSVGPGLGELGCLDNYSTQPVMAKFIYSIDMFMGRVEIFPLLVVLSMIFKRR
ncbi:MAG: TrkH family potassium uptake protein [Bacteroidales bacterium]|nr:TrkH family potassium uptake protein [Bacteroidales bacterium]